MPKGTSEMTDKAIGVAMAQVGKKYVWGHEGPDTFDCSGLLWYAYKQAGFSVGGRWTTWTMLASMEKVAVKSVQPGDFLFPHTGHVVMFIGNGKIVEAPNKDNPIRVRPVTDRTWFTARRFGTPGTKGGTPTTGDIGGVMPGDNDFSDAVEKLTDPRTWLRVGMGLGGALAVLLGLVVLGRTFTVPAVKSAMGVKK